MKSALDTLTYHEIIRLIITHFEKDPLGVSSRSCNETIYTIDQGELPVKF